MTFVRAEERHFAPEELNFIIDDRDAGDPVDEGLVQQPVTLVRRQSGNKVKKRRSFREKMAKRLSSGN